MGFRHKRAKRKKCHHLFDSDIFNSEVQLSWEKDTFCYSNLLS
uniref:Uncharacterized protein n=1 Tax=Klebsiella pneumoniae TaxID=573 RepID=A0A8B0SSG9_KLEPN|nr:hypothetical protein [Klebsiella pneumoniae]